MLKPLQYAEMHVTVTLPSVLLKLPSDDKKCVLRSLRDRARSVVQTLGAEAKCSAGIRHQKVRVHVSLLAHIQLFH